MFVQVPEVGHDGRRPATRSARSSRPSRCPTSTRRSPARSSRSTPTSPTRPQRLNEDPYGEGWLCVIEPDDAAEVDALLDADGYRALDRRVRRRAGGVSDVFCNQCGHRNPLGLQLLLVVRRGPRAGSGDDHHDHLHTRSTRAGDAGRRTRSRVDLDDLPAGVGLLVVQAGPERRVAVRSSTSRRHHGRAPPRQRHLPRRHHRVAPPRRDRARSTTAIVVRDVGSLNGTYLNRERIERGAARQRRRAADRQVQARVPRRTGRERPSRRDRARLPVDRRGPRPPAGRVPRRHDLEDPLPREPGPARPRAHAVGLPQVLRGRHRAPALDPAPAAARTSCRSR